MTSSPTSDAERTAFHPLVSVIMGVFNREQFHAQSLESILRQTLPAFELIAVNDGSTDSSGEILREYARRDNRVTVIWSENNCGIARSLNRAISQARAEYLAVMDSDDVALPARLETELGFLRAHSEIALVGARASLVDYRGTNIPADVNLPCEHGDIDDALLAGGWPIIHPTVMMRKSAIKQIGGYNENFRANVDHDMFLRLAEKARLANLPDVLLLYRIHHKAMTAQRTSDDHCSVQQQAIKEACQRRCLPYPPKVKPVNRGLNFQGTYWGTGVRGARQLGGLLFRSPGAFLGQTWLALRRSRKLRKLLRLRRS